MSLLRALNNAQPRHMFKNEKIFDIFKGIKQNDKNL